MSRVQMLRAVADQRLTAAVEEIFGEFETMMAEYEEELSREKEENGGRSSLEDGSAKTSRVQTMRAMVEQRLTAAFEEIYGPLESMMAEYEEEVARAKQENQRQADLLDAVFNSDTQTRRAGQ